MFFFDANGNQLAETQTNTTDSINNSGQYDIGVPYQGWSLNATAPAGATQAKVEFAGYGGGSVWFDNAVLWQSNSASTLSPAITLPLTVNSSTAVGPTNFVTTITENGDGTMTLNFEGSAGVAYFVQMATNLVSPIYWQALPDSTNQVTDPTGSWFCIVTNTGSQRFYRSAVAGP